MNVIPTGDVRLQRMEQAALWLQRIHAAADDEQVLEAWLDWCQRDPLNQQAFDELATVWELGGAIDSLEPQSAADAGQDGGASHDAAATRAAGWTRRGALAASLAALVASGVAGLWWVNRHAAQEVAGIEFSSPTGVNSVQRLPDGSVLELGGGTRVTVLIDERRRRVQLHEGEVYVTVKKDEQRPFSVQAGRLEAVATGTAFNVLRTEGRVTVTVAEGSVEAHYDQKISSMPRNRLQPHQQLVYWHASHSVDVRNVDPARAIAWRRGQLHFDAEALSEVIATVNRYAPRPIVVEDERVAALGYTGTVNVDNIRGWLNGLQHIFQVAVVQLPDGRQRIDARPGTAAD